MIRTGFEIREGSRMIEERIRRAEQQEARARRLALLRKNLYVAIKQVDAEIKAGRAA